ncbi:hypothetical protein NEOLEDRAFT_706772 [Neolentinus lepideus HHB14362 ss-1]|uniref:Uncharacterized protein n=1 Tax=Neolentinus lepideus HHB14362 ss-1 TaxID=1314782 RepID=A0A165Q6F9_9AGAM|nr:hypothetical protein NEOLEDRAFT_706772 [Neolentinus lepideus HHB14362 ss-1]
MGGLPDFLCRSHNPADRTRRGEDSKVGRDDWVWHDLYGWRTRHGCGLRRGRKQGGKGAWSLIYVIIAARRYPRGIGADGEWARGLPSNWLLPSSLILRLNANRNIRLSEVHRDSLLLMNLIFTA